MVQEPTLLFKCLKTKQQNKTKQNIANTSTLSYTLVCRNKQRAWKVYFKAPKKIRTKQTFRHMSSKNCTVTHSLYHFMFIC